MSKELHHVDFGFVPVMDHVYKLSEIDRSIVAPQKSPEWYERRRNYLTASAIAAVLGKCPYQTRDGLMQSKLRPMQDSNAFNPATSHGVDNEAFALKEYERRTNRPIFPFGLLESLNSGENYLAGSPDGITSCGRLIEVKCPYRRKPTHEIPKYYMYQIQYLMHMLQLRVCDFVQYIPETTWNDMTFLITEVPYDAAFILLTKPAIASFWDELNEKKLAMQQSGDLGNDLHIVEVKTETIPSWRFQNNSKRSPLLLEGCLIKVDNAKRNKAMEQNVEIEEQKCRILSNLKVQ